MAEKAQPKKEPAETKTSSRARTSADETFSAEERAAMKERAKELRAGAKRGTKADPEKDLLEKLAEMPDADRVIAERLHALVAEHAPNLKPKLWYGMPAYARDGKIVCFFQGAAKFKTRYSTIGFQDTANLDDGALWPTSFAVTSIGPAEEKFLADLLRRAES